MEKLLNGLIAAAESTAGQATGNDRAEWNHFADALRKLRDEAEDEAQPKPAPQA
jgi:hypothetical protein